MQESTNFNSIKVRLEREVSIYIRVTLSRNFNSIKVRLEPAREPGIFESH